MLKHTISMIKSDHPVTAKQPHFMFSVENPLHPAKYAMSHDEAIKALTKKGYKVEPIIGTYGGSKEKSILVHNPRKEAVQHLMGMAKDLGQESSVLSDGFNHELHFHNGENAGKHVKGQGTDFPTHEPEDNFSTLKDGSHFVHNLNFDTFHPHESSMLHHGKLKKSEEDTLHKHGGELAPDTKLIHFSAQKDLKEIDPHFHGKRKIGAEARHGAPENRMAFFYLNGTKPEEIVTQGTNHKYVSELGDKKIYDIAQDHLKLWDKAKQEASKREVNPGAVSTDDFHNVIRKAGFHGIRNSSLDNTMKNVVGMFEKMPIKASYPIHPNDLIEASDKNHHLKKTEELDLNKMSQPTLRVPKEKGISDKPEQQVYPLDMWSGKSQKVPSKTGKTTKKIDYPTKKIQDIYPEFKQKGAKAQMSQFAGGGMEGTAYVRADKDKSFIVAGKGADEGTKEHEASHLLSHQIIKKHGMDAAHKFYDTLLSRVHPKLDKFVEKRLKSFGYTKPEESAGPEEHLNWKSEKVNLIRDSLVPGSRREHFKSHFLVEGQNPVENEQFKMYDKMHKQTWKDLVNVGKHYKFGQKSKI